ncbi:hypothetical protein FRC08_002700 [Ceratobasidium sp. 394]|nr:hypothetical protein FRC08_002700 [Ceratobasidium sp. 394]
MPRIWFSDSTDTFIRAHPPWGSSTFKGAAPWLTSAWRLVPGSHLSAEVGHITRKFISSSIWRDTITQLKPSYVEVALFPIATTQTVPFLAGNTSIATGIITPSLRTSYTAFKSKALFDPSTLGDSDLEACDYIEDVRSHTILDVVGSIGGLFALLQFLHVFLFGRPMLWGLTGAKLITPFGFCGSFGSQSFRRRLRDNYYSTPSGGTDETLRVDAFMRDFVIDLGPAATDASTAGGCSTGTAQRQSDVEANTSGVDHQSTTAEVDTSVAHNR